MSTEKWSNNSNDTQTRLTALFSGTTRVSWYQKSKTNLDFTEARDSEWQWHQLGRMQVCTSLQTDNHASTGSTSSLSLYRPDALPAAQPTVQSTEGFSSDNSTVSLSWGCNFSVCVTYCGQVCTKVVDVVEESKHSGSTRCSGHLVCHRHRTVPVNNN